MKIARAVKKKEDEQMLTAHGTVCAMGELAYRDRDTGQSWRMTRLPKVGDQVTYGKYAGQRIVRSKMLKILLPQMIGKLQQSLRDEVNNLHTFKGGYHGRSQRCNARNSR